MAESITSRVSRIITGNVHHLIDSIENANPQAVMAQAIREVDGIIDEVSVALGRATANKHLAVNRLAEQNRRHEQLSADIELALNEEREDLAKAAVAAQLDVEAQVPVLEHSIANAANEEHEYQGYLTALRARRREMEDTLNEFIASRKQVSESPTATSPDHRLEKAGATFDRVLARQTGLGGLNAPIDAAQAGKMRELADLARNNRIEERLAAIRSRTGKQE
ncbi:MAG: PspA/IM30 family protein [Betaproteobacteria bacterium]|nr:PspA/IM30 family protein [Betaproteobacteria bacterium]